MEEKHLSAAPNPRLASTKWMGETMALFSRSKKVTCDRCKQSAKADYAVAMMWTVTNSDVQVPGYLCYECQTSEERREAHGEVDLFRSYGGHPIARLPDGTAVTRVLPMGGLTLAQDESKSVTYVCRGDSLRGFLSESDVLPLRLPGGQLSSWEPEDVRVTAEFAKLSLDHGWDALAACVAEVLQRKDPLDS